MILTMVKPEVKLINAQDLRQKMREKSVFLVDVREKEEYILGHIPTAILKPLSQFNPEEWHYKHDVILYCRSGKRSHQVAEKLIEIGCTSVTELEGGIMAWQTANFPISN